MVLIHSQADYFHEIVLKIEGDDIPATDVAFLLEELRGNIVLRRNENYLSPETEAEMINLKANHEWNEAVNQRIMVDFYGDIGKFPFIFMSSI